MDICARYYSPRNRLPTGPTDHGRLVGHLDKARMRLVADAVAGLGILAKQRRGIYNGVRSRGAVTVLLGSILKQAFGPAFSFFHQEDLAADLYI